MKFVLVLASLGLAFLVSSCSSVDEQAGAAAATVAATEKLSTNWFAVAQSILPPRYQGQNLSFGQITNLLSREARRGNAAAQELWGYALVSMEQSPAEVTAGINLLRTSAEKGFVPSMVNLGFVYRSGKYGNTNEAFHWFSLAADRGNADAEAQVGNCYFTGRGVGQDYRMAAKWYRRAADHNHYEAMKSLGYMLLNGLGVEKDMPAARYWTEKAAKEGHNRRAMLNMGAICSQEPNGAGMAESFRWYKQSAELGDPLACFELARFYYNGWGGVSTNEASYREWLFRAADLGCTEAQFFVGQIYRAGVGVSADEGIALKWYHKAAEKNEPRALYDLAVLCWQDKSNRTALAKASDYMRRAAEGGHRDAQFNYAVSLFRGDAGTLDFEAGKRWLAKAAENGWPKAEFLQFQLYYNGSSPMPGGTRYPQDKLEGVKWLRRAAEHGDLTAQSLLAVMLIRGNDVEQNKVEAEKLLRDAASHGFAQAQNDLGYAILSGSTAKRDWVECAMWCKLAENNSTDSNVSTRAKVNYTNAAGQLTPEELSEVERRAASFHPLPVPQIDPLVSGWEKNPLYQPE
jgi:TPR repeat protein